MLAHQVVQTSHGRCFKRLAEPAEIDPSLLVRRATRAVYERMSVFVRASAAAAADVLVALLEAALYVCTWLKRTSGPPHNQDA
jgi:hypothetical protein